eukprot:scaffold21488_cov67-Phaeocystis_antarctica.AAC.2
MPLTISFKSAWSQPAQMRAALATVCTLCSHSASIHCTVWSAEGRTCWKNSMPIDIDSVRVI